MDKVNTVCVSMSSSLSQSNPSHLSPQRELALTHSSKQFSVTSNNLKMRKIDSDNSVRLNSNASNYSNAISQRKKLRDAVANRTSPLLVKPEMLKIPQNMVFLSEILDNKIDIKSRTTGIANISVKYFYAAWDKSTTLTKNFPSMLYVFENRVRNGLSAYLLIRWSRVRISPDPPRCARYDPVTLFTQCTGHILYTFSDHIPITLGPKGFSIALTFNILEQGHRLLACGE